MKELIEAYEDLISQGANSLCRAYIKTWCKFNMIDNNIFKTFNAYIRKGKEKLLLEMLDYIRNI